MKSDVLTRFITRIEDPSRIYFTSDTHASHLNVLKYCNRPFADVDEMNEVLVRNWNSVVGPDDHVYHLGDFSMGGFERWNWFAEEGRLNGHIHLILGNHDIERLLKENFNFDRFDSIELEHILIIEGWHVFLNHFPFASFSGNYDGKVMALSGHTHVGQLSSAVESYDALNAIYKPNQYDVGIDNNNFTPVSWAEVKNKVTVQIENNVNLMYWFKK